MGLAVTAAVLLSHRPTRVERLVRSAAVFGRVVVPRRHVDALAASRITGALCGATAGAVLSWVVGSPIPIAVATWVGATAPILVRERRDARRARDAERACVTLVEWLCALVAAGRPVETALVSVATRGCASASLDECLTRVRRDYTLGVPLHAAVSREAASSGIRGLAELGTRLERARDLGRGAAPLLSDLRDDLRAAERARALRAASGVEGKLTLVMTLCYLPALALLVIVPLFLTLLAGLFA